MSKHPVLAVDGTGLLVRCSRAAPPLAAPDGTPTGTLLLFINALARKVRQADPSHIVIAWDGPGAWDWRRSLYPGYKAGRPGTGGNLGAEVLQAVEFCAAAGMFQVQVPGFEADDVLGWVTRAALHLPGKLLLLASDDDDMLQLLSDSEDSLVYLTGLGHDHVITAAGAEAVWGLSPMWLPKIRALAGDSSDGIPGLPGVGPKRALRMLQEGGLRWPLPESIIKDPEQRRLTVIWRDIMDLVIPAHPVEPEMGTICCQLGDLTRWDPQAGEDVLHLLERYGMTRIALQLQRGGLWAATQAA